MPSDIDELRRELDIVEVISDYIRLERAGNNYKANCPFHPDRTPSFHVSPSKQIFKCFGCGVGGDAIKFVSLYENVSYIEAAKQLAKRYGIKLRIREESSEKRRIHEVLESVAEFYHRSLKENREALEYLRERGIDTSMVKKFMLGFSPSSSELVNLLKDMNALELYSKTGNIKLVQEERYRDLFANRLVIPIRDPQGRFTGFGGRLLKGEGPKYVNSPESEVFKKRELLFGFYEGLSYLRELKSALLVEGYFDVMALHQEGFRNAVATLGTALGREHAALLSKVVDRVYLLFDGDEAGRRAMRLAVPHLLREGLDVYPLFLPEGIDPHDFVLREGRKAMKALIESVSDVFELLKDRIRKGVEVENSIKDFTYFLSFMKDEIRAFTLLSELSRLTKIPVDILSTKLYKAPERIEEENERLSFTEKVFLKGLLELRPEVDLEELNLSLRAREYARSIINEEYYHIPEEVINLKTTDIERDFRASLEKLRIHIPEEELTEAVGVRESVREFIRKHKGGIRPNSVRRWRGKLES
ncbi:DNA primase [Hydrogenivirga sp.]